MRSKTASIGLALLFAATAVAGCGDALYLLLGLDQARQPPPPEPGDVQRPEDHPPHGTRDG